MHAPISSTSRVTLTSDGTVEGYASLFGEVDQARDMVMPGAFTQTLKQRGLRKIPMLFQHDPSEPVGIWLELREDFRGLWARGRLIPEVARGRELMALVQQGAIDGLSIGYRTVRGRIDPQTRIRKLYQVDLWEISIVTFPLLAGARVRAVKQSRHPPPPAGRLRSGRALILHGTRYERVAVMSRHADIFSGTTKCAFHAAGCGEVAASGASRRAEVRSGPAEG